MSPYATKLKVADLGISCHSKGIDEFALLLDWEEDITLYTQNKGRHGCERTKAFGQFRQVWSLVGWRGM